MNVATHFSRIPAVGLVVLQLTIGVAGIAVATLATSDGNALLLVPLTRAARIGLPARALGAGTRLLGAGILPGSLIVRRDDGGEPASFESDVVAIRVPARLCGTT